MRPVTLYSLLRRTGQPHTQRWRPEALSTDTARRLIRCGRRSTATVHVYETTDRAGTPLHIAHVHFGPELYDGADFVTDIYEIPAGALTSL
ncbi:hypothetical protein ACFCXT_27685 [Streptomyces vinaceus]|uniref:hypothetical protein n=1 Tax=Streptomyces vinaceus TaxID=1960 RepID=UPI0035E1A320